MGKSQDIKSQRDNLESVIVRLKKQYRWGHISQKEYLREYQETEARLCQLQPAQEDDHRLKGLAYFLPNVSVAWREATQEQRNKLARTLFAEIK